MTRREPKNPRFRVTMNSLVQVWAPRSDWHGRLAMAMLQIGSGYRVQVDGAQRWFHASKLREPDFTRLLEDAWTCGDERRFMQVFTDAWLWAVRSDEKSILARIDFASIPQHRDRFARLFNVELQGCTTPERKTRDRSTTATAS